ncbi:hypothetical protein I6A60_26855 [Frankia sp. AgB1.9]|uniref:hypothetical protein n=1 Tax=Frankia sp. AgB1.9 TaxID=1836968 RepID=UPI0019342BAA|nr:hypothetical protein [Frankia sp. AgB1.9]MBL7551448.1 hypothetical protein [Frankia sp. AgB1.9]
MRLDEHGRWVSDDGAYVWDESAQTWQPTTSRPGGTPAAGPTGPSAARGGGGTGAYGPGGPGGAGHRPAQAETGGYGRPGTGQQGYEEPRTGSFPLFGADPRGGREASWAPATGPYPQPSATGRPGSGYSADPATGATPLDTGTNWRAGAAPTRGGADRGQGGPGAPAAPGTGQSRSWSARDPLGTGPYSRPDPAGGGPYDRADPLGTGPYDRADPLGTGGPARGGYDRADPLSGPFNRADPLGTGPSTGNWARGGTGPSQSRGPATGPAQSRAGSGGTGPSSARGADGLDGGPGSAMNRAAAPVLGVDTTGPLPTDVGARGGSGRFSTSSFTKAGSGTGPRMARPSDDLDDDLGRDVDDLLVDDEDDEDAADDQGGLAGARGRLRGLARMGGADPGRRGGPGHDEDEDEDDDDLDEDDERGGRARSAGALVGKVRASRGRMLALGAAVLVVVIVAVVLVLKTTGGSGSSGTTTTAGGTAAAARQYDASIRKVYLDQCVQQSNGAQAYCNCTLQKLEAGYSQEDFLRINADPTSATGQRVVKEIKDACKSLR